jgi:hypothetical protein
MKKEFEYEKLDCFGKLAHLKKLFCKITHVQKYLGNYHG